MKHDVNCRFCDIISGKYKYHGIDEPLAANEEFFAIASIGAFVEGWTLIVPQRHQLSMRDCYKSKHLPALVNDIVDRLRAKYGSIISFEHGSNSEGSATACGTDHAHFHLVPFKGSLVPDMQKSQMEWVRCRTSEIAARASGREYLFYSDIDDLPWDDPSGYLHVLDTPVSQYFRQLLADKKDCAEKSDYKLFPFLNRSIQTRIALSY